MRRLLMDHGGVRLACGVTGVRIQAEFRILARAQPACATAWGGEMGAPPGAGRGSDQAGRGRIAVEGELRVRVGGG